MSEFILQRGDDILQHCSNTIKLYEDWNAYIQKEHEQNRSLFIHPVILSEPEDTKKPKRKVNINYVKPIDPLEATLEQVNFEFQANQKEEATLEDNEFRRTHSFKFYRERRNNTKPDPKIEVNKIRYKGPDETSGRMTRIPNTSSLIGPVDTYRSTLHRKIKIRKNTLQNSQSTLRPNYVKVPKDIMRTAYKPDPRETNPKFHFCTLECEEIELKIKKTQKEIENHLKHAELSAQRISEVLKPSEPNEIRKAKSPRRNFQKKQ